MLLLLLLPLLLSCRVHNGQDLHMHHRDPANLLLGLFGTLIFYDHVTSNALLPLEEMVRVTKILRSIRVSRACCLPCCCCFGVLNVAVLGY